MKLSRVQFQKQIQHLVIIYIMTIMCMHQCMCTKSLMLIQTRGQVLSLWITGKDLWHQQTVTGRMNAIFLGKNKFGNLILSHCYVNFGSHLSFPKTQFLV